MMAPGQGGQMMPSSGGKRKEIYKYDAPFTLYAMSWSNRPDKKYRLALGSFIEEYSNKVLSVLFILIFKSIVTKCINTTTIIMVKNSNLFASLLIEGYFYRFR